MRMCERKKKEWMLEDWEEIVGFVGEGDGY